MKDLTNDIIKEQQKIVLITGCSSNIGLQLAKQLAENSTDGNKDYLVYATGCMLNDELKNVASDVCRVKKMNLTNSDECREVIDGILSEHGNIDILVHCTSVNHYEAIEKITTEKARAVMDINVTGIINVTSMCLPRMKENASGHIVVVSSFSGIIGVPFNSIHSASKFAIEGYCESLRDEVARHNIRVNIVEVGPVTSSEVDKELLEQLSSNNEDENKLMEIFKQKMDASNQTMGQSPDLIAKQIKTIIESPNNGQFRYETNQIYANALSKVFKEKTNIQQARMFSLSGGTL
ncbi:3-ketodihydrosphingosine reductase-like isoform X1 [Clytia hemisphaerica]|uniref:3-ketodihydrosphingosine reductase-like isoform X1 n=1 Tax=Clytia hemisphaerica TaxID=252671 RepID=UPI0034D6AADD